MRLAQGYDAVDGRGDPYFSPDRQRLMDPAVRRRLAGYLCGGTGVAIGYRTDGYWVWHEAVALHALDHHVAPEEAFLTYIETAGYLPPENVPEDAITGAARLITDSRPLPAGSPHPEAAYFIRVDAEFPPDAPLSLLRRIRGPDGAQLDQAIWRDLRWHPTNTFIAQARNNEYDLRPVTPERAAEILDQWCLKWAADRPPEADGPDHDPSVAAELSDGMTRGGV